jgi:hypothetical protein
MKEIGIHGGSNLWGLGPAHEVELFFKAVELFAKPRNVDLPWDLILDRFFKRYIHLENSQQANELMVFIQKEFSSLDATLIDLAEVQRLNPATKLKLSGANLAEVFGVYFEAFAHCIESAKLGWEDWKDHPGYTYQALRLGVVDIPAFMQDKQRPLSAYDELTGEPFWLK